MNKKIRNSLYALAACTLAACTPQGAAVQPVVEYTADSVAVVRVAQSTKYLLLPIQESRLEAKVRLNTGSAADTYMDIRLAVDSVDYYVPFALPGGDAVIDIVGLDSTAIVWKEMKLSDEFDTSEKDYYHPNYHHTPPYGWMNDPNGMVYKDGEYHLYFQFNPYGSKWGNMHWGHSVSKDLIHWEHLEPAIARDTLGHIFSGSSVVDKDNTAGFGKDAIVAFYTSHKWLEDGTQWQAQSLAYSTDGGNTYTKYENNPVLLPFDGVKDFRDPKVFWYEPAGKWYMIVSADKEMRFYSSANLKDWEYLSAFGQGWGVQPNQFECPDFFEMQMGDDPTNRKWVMIVNINPGCVFGGSATEYFVGTFDGKNFTPETPKNVTKWLDFGKDHYAFVTFSNTGNRILGLPWTSNWQYANITPLRQSRGANGLVRELSLFTKDGNTYIASTPAKENEALRKDTKVVDDFDVTGEHPLNDLLQGNEGAYEIDFTIDPGTSTRAGFELLNSKGEVVPIYFDFEADKFVMDRTKSGLVDFGKNAQPHDIENHDRRKHESINYVNDFALATWAPLSLLDKGEYRVCLFIDKSTVEIFINGGRVAMTNLVFPTEPYSSVRFFTQGGTAKVKDMKVYTLGL